MFLAFDIGNSAVKIGLHDETSWVAVERMEAAEKGLHDLLSAMVEGVRVDAAGIASVVPKITDHVRSLLHDRCGVEAAMVGADSALPFSMSYQTPQTLGADRIAAAAAAWIRFGKGEKRSVVVVDAGTAVTTEIITADGAYLGGAIAPGPQALRRALVRETAQLPETAWPDTIRAVGSSTSGAIEAGVSVMFLDGVRGLLERSATELGDTPYIVATGGWGLWLADHLDEIDVVEPHLVLDGIRLLMR